MTDELELHWTPEQRDLTDAFSARRYALGFRRRELVTSLAFAAAGVVLAFLLSNPGSLVLLFVGAVFLFPGTARAQARWAVRRLWKANPQLASPVHVTLTDDGMRYASQTDDTFRAWSAYSRWIEAENVIVLCISDRIHGAFVTLAKRGLAASSDVERVRAILGSSIGEAARLPQGFA